MVSSLLIAIAALFLVTRVTAAAEMSVEQVKSALQRASAEAPADLRGKDLSDLDLSRLDFRHANLRGASFFGSKLVLADFRGATLEGANLNGAWLMGTDFTGANLTRASLLSVVVLGGEVKKMPVFKGANLTGVKMIADLPGADLSGANFSNAMVGVNIKNQGMGQMRTDLSSANLAGANLAGADFNRSLMAFCQPEGQQPARRQLLPRQAGRRRPDRRRRDRRRLHRGRSGRDDLSRRERHGRGQGARPRRQLQQDRALIPATAGQRGLPHIPPGELRSVNLCGLRCSTPVATGGHFTTDRSPGRALMTSACRRASASACTSVVKLSQ